MPYIPQRPEHQSEIERRQWNATYLRDSETLEIADGLRHSEDAEERVSAATYYIRSLPKKTLTARCDTGIAPMLTDPAVPVMNTARQIFGLSPSLLSECPRSVTYYSAIFTDLNDRSLQSMFARFPHFMRNNVMTREVIGACARFARAATTDAADPDTTQGRIANSVLETIYIHRHRLAKKADRRTNEKVVSIYSQLRAKHAIHIAPASINS